MKRSIASSLLPSSPLPLIVGAVVFATSVSAQESGGGDLDYYLDYYHICDPAIAAISAWLVLVITLEINDFRNHLKRAHISEEGEDESNNNTQIPHHRYIASLVATRLGLRDALVDVAILYSITYAIVAGFTWGDADPNSKYVIRGLSAIVSACILAESGFKIPRWLGFYRKSKLQFLKETSNRAPRAVHDLTVEGSSLTSFRNQVRLGVGKHTTQFVFFQLPFYTDLKIWSYFVTLLVGFIFGHVYLYVVFKCRTRFRKHRGYVAMGASVALSIISALVFVFGMHIIDSVWQWEIASKKWVLSLASFFGWLVLLLMVQAMQYFEQDFSSEESQLDEKEEVEHLFIDDDPTEHEGSLTPIIEGTEVEQQQQEVETSVSVRVEEQPIGSAGENRRYLYKKESMDDAGQDYFYQTGYFDRVAVSSRHSKKELVVMNGITKGGIDEKSTPKQIYNAFAEVEQCNQDIKWYHRLWKFLPFKSTWSIFSQSCASTWGCCRKDSEFQKESCFQKLWHVVVKILTYVINLLAIYVALVSMAATFQISRTKAKLPYVRGQLYTHMNDGPVCAFDEKCGDIKEFSSKAEAVLANYSVAHCGPCASCSSWNDMELQYSTRTNLAELAQKCGIKTMGKPVGYLQQCLETDIGWTEDCARCWAEDIFCTKKFCIFIYLQSRMTNQLGNFKVNPNTITSATCEEANCEAGNPGEFVKCSGSNRRRMNIVSGIQRPAEEQCQIVDVNDWGPFFEQKC